MTRVSVVVSEPSFTGYPLRSNRKTLELHHIHVGYLCRKLCVVLSAQVTAMTGYSVRSVTITRREILHTYTADIL